MSSSLNNLNQSDWTILLVLAILVTCTFQHLPVARTSTRYLSYLTNSSQWFFCSDKFSTVFVMCNSIDILHKYVCSGKNDSNQSIFLEYTHKMVPDVHMLCSLTCHEVLWHEDCSNIVYSHYDWKFHQNHDWLHHWHDELYFFCCFQKCSECPTSLNERVMLLWPLLCKLIGTPNSKIQKPITLTWDSMSPAKSLSENTMTPYASSAWLITGFTFSP